jgi:hypothetical protein
MTYTKPEVAILGDANYVIQGNKTINVNDGANPAPGPAPFEIED